MKESCDGAFKEGEEELFTPNERDFLFTRRGNDKERDGSQFGAVFDADILLVGEEELQEELEAWSVSNNEGTISEDVASGILDVKSWTGCCTELTLPDSNVGCRKGKVPGTRVQEELLCDTNRVALLQQNSAFSDNKEGVKGRERLSRETPTKHVRFNDLPEELALKIFSYLRPRELCRYVAPVCVRWLQFSRDPSLWKFITRKEFKDVPDDLFLKVLTSWCPLLKSVDFRCRTALEESDFNAIFSSCPMIEQVSFAFCSQLDQNVFYSLSKYCKCLTDINVEGTRIKDSSFIPLLGLPLTRVNASHCTFLSDEGLIFLANNFSNLKEINFDGVQWITHASLKVLVDNHHKTLEHIILDGADLMDESVQLLTMCQSARTIHLSFCDSLTDVSLKSLKMFCNLESLQLKKGMNFTNAGILDLLNELHFQHTTNSFGLTELNLAECTLLSDECLLCIAEGCPNLKSLGLDWCWEVTDDGIDFLMDNCHSLAELFLCGLHELYGAPFARIPKETPALTYLDLRQCNKVSDDFLVEIVQQMPYLTILNYYGDIVQGSLHFWSLDSKCSPELTFGYQL